MAEPDFEMNRHDRLPSIQTTLNADLTNALSVNFIMRKSSSTWVPDFTVPLAVNAAAVKVSSAPWVPDSTNPAGGTGGSQVRYDWLAIDTATAGFFVVQWQIIWPGSKPQTFPTRAYNTLVISADLDDA